MRVATAGSMTRRSLVALGAVGLAGGESPLIVPIHRVMNARAKCPPAALQRFWWSIWPEAVRDFQRSGIRLHTTDATGEIRRSPGDRPIFTQLEGKAVNIVVTDHIPPSWDNGRALAGVTTIVEGRHLCVIAVRYAHGHQIPFLSVNTCVHELLHVLLQDIFIRRPVWHQAGSHEARIDWHATRMWLFRDGEAVRRSAQEYLRRLKWGGA